MVSITGMTFLWYYSTVSVALLSTLYSSHFAWSLICATNPVRLFLWQWHCSVTLYSTCTILFTFLSHFPAGAGQVNQQE
jgi:hypothetical protein